MGLRRRRVRTWAAGCRADGGIRRGRPGSQFRVRGPLAVPLQRPGLAARAAIIMMMIMMGTARLAVTSHGFVKLHCNTLCKEYRVQSGPSPRPEPGTS